MMGKRSVGLKPRYLQGDDAPWNVLHNCGLLQSRLLNSSKVYLTLAARSLDS